MRFFFFKCNPGCSEWQLLVVMSSPLGVAVAEKDPFPLFLLSAEKNATEAKTNCWLPRKQANTHTHKPVSIPLRACMVKQTEKTQIAAFTHERPLDGHSNPSLHSFINPDSTLVGAQHVHTNILTYKIKTIAPCLCTVSVPLVRAVMGLYGR